MCVCVYVFACDSRAHVPSPRPQMIIIDWTWPIQISIRRVHLRCCSIPNKPTEHSSIQTDRSASRERHRARLYNYIHSRIEYVTCRTYIVQRDGVHFYIWSHWYLFGPFLVCGIQISVPRWLGTSLPYWRLRKRTRTSMGIATVKRHTPACWRRNAVAM